MAIVFKLCRPCAAEIGPDPTAWVPGSTDLTARCFLCGQHINQPPTREWAADVEAEAAAYRARHPVGHIQADDEPPGA